MKTINDFINSISKIFSTFLILLSMAFNRYFMYLLSKIQETTKTMINITSNTYTINQICSLLMHYVKLICTTDIFNHMSFKLSSLCIYSIPLWVILYLMALSSSVASIIFLSINESIKSMQYL